MLLQGGETEIAENDSDSLSPQETKRRLDKPRRNGESGISNGQNPGNLQGRAISALSSFGKNAIMEHPQAIMEPPSNRC